jgi:hypothetical protein
MDMSVVKIVPTRAADVTLFGCLKIDDFLSVITGWGTCPQPPAMCPADINCSGGVDIDDLLAVINGWGA